MARRTVLMTAATAVGLGLLVLGVPPARGADGSDGPQATANPAADLADLYAWMSPDATKLNLVVTVWPAAPESAALSPAVQYVVHVRSGEAMRKKAQEIPILCQTAGAELECWVGDTGVYLRGDASMREGIATPDGRLRVFAGLSDDPFFFNRGGFERFVEIILGWADALAPLRDGAGCPAMTQEQSDTSVHVLSRDRAGGQARNDLAGQRVIALSIQVDAALVSPGGPVLGVWATTRRRP